MDLSEFFKAKEQNKNYVEYPPQESPSLDKFFAERSILNQPAVEKKPVAPNMFGGSLMPDAVNTAQSSPKKTYIDPVSEEDKAAAIESDPVDEDRLQQIKMMFSPEAQMQVTAPQQESQPAQRFPANEYMQDVKNIREAVDANGHKLGAADLAPVIAPLLADLFTGGTGVSAGVVSGYLGDKLKGTEAKNANLEKYLLERQKALMSKKDTATRRFQPKNIIDKETGRAVYANYDTATGNFYLPDGTPLDSSKVEVGFSVTPEEFNRRAEKSTEEQIKRGDYFGRGVRLDPNTGLLAKVENGKLIPISTKEASLNPKQQKDLTTIVRDFTTKDLYKKTAQVLAASSQVSELISLANDKKNAAASNSARVQLSRMSGEVGALSDSDIERAGGSPSIKEKAKRFTNLQKSGVPISPRDIREISEVAAVYEKVARRKLNDAVALMEVDFVQNYGGIPGAVQTKMNALIPSTHSPKSEVKFPRTVRKDGATAKVSNQQELEEAMSEGWE